MSYNLQHTSGVTGPLGNPTVIESAGTANEMSHSAFPFAVDGIAYTKAADTDFPFTAGHTSLAAGESCIFLLQTTTGGTISTKQSNIADNDSGELLVWPEADDGQCAFAALKVRCNSTAVFVPNTTDLGAANVVDTFYNFALGGPSSAGLIA
jgi:hypothetical protein